MTNKKKSIVNKDGTEQSQKNIVITVDDDYLSDIQKVAKQLRSRGMVVDDVLESIGIISGSGAAADLRSVPGVANVEEQTHFQLPPPDAPIK